FSEAMRTAQDAGATPQMDAATLNPTFGYADDAGRKHAVWFLDGPTLFNQIKVADGFRPMGYALWRMGGEDPSDWKLLRHEFGRADATGLETLQPGQDVDFDGTGEVLSVESIPKAGRRALQTDAATGLISGEDYHV